MRVFNSVAPAFLLRKYMPNRHFLMVMEELGELVVHAAYFRTSLKSIILPLLNFFTELIGIAVLCNHIFLGFCSNETGAYF